MNTYCSFKNLKKNMKNESQNLIWSVKKVFSVFYTFHTISRTLKILMTMTLTFDLKSCLIDKVTHLDHIYHSPNKSQICPSVSEEFSHTETHRHTAMLLVLWYRLALGSNSHLSWNKILLMTECPIHWHNNNSYQHFVSSVLAFLSVT